MEQEPRHQPFDVAIEQALLGALLVDNRLIDIASADLEPVHFYEGLHSRMFEFISYLVTEGAVTPLILNSVMKTDPGLVEIGGVAYLAGLAAAAPAMPNVRDYSRILRDLATRRTLIRIGEDLAAAAHSPPGAAPARALADEATEALLQASGISAAPMLSPYETAMESLREAEAIKQGRPVPLVKTGFSLLDEEIGGLRGGDLITVPAKSGMGKSALMGGLALNTARAGIPTLVFSLEMTRRQWVERMVCDIDFSTCEKPMWYSQVRNGRLSDDEFTRFAMASRELEGLPIEIIDDDDLTLSQIFSRARAFAAKHKKRDGTPSLGVVVLDYFQIINPGENRERNTREQVVNGFARGLKKLAKRLGWPVVAGSQMNENDTLRAKEERRPQGGDVRESKGIFNESDLMLSPYRPAYFVENRKPEAAPGDPSWIVWRGELAGVEHKFEILGLKNRHGRRFNVELYCEIGANAVRDFAPYKVRSEPEKAQADFLRSVDA